MWYSGADGAFGMEHHGNMFHLKSIGELSCRTLLLARESAAAIATESSGVKSSDKHACFGEVHGYITCGAES